ncbi:protein unc-80 homolog isoform X10 [Tribolium castaneum]|uniref:protein unc-80 homolog isoform X10 n=1 Tax=Tribolium castaneum TaxID=7070 RepID=UPI00077DD7D1|nr:PREDICTED: protein unc-80 homolog isoform X9 [Tribolium castaneum]|eukprot:XP_015837449.1 PREDICTED: protein unc-80 homolog isoform X9 [Tribolium castaneum]
MPDSDRSSGDNNFNDEALPIPIQVFLWRQVSPFVKPKLGKLHEASCMFCQHSMTGHHELKEACKIFEKVLVQNIQSGLKPDLCEAIRSIPRWKLIQASLPHVMHSTASLLFTRMKDGNIQSLGAVETKLMYTLHWIILDAAEECADSDYEKGIFHSSPFYYLFSIPTITLFVYLFAPMCHHLKESDFQNFRLENGLKIWQAMWEFRHPEALCFTSHCKPKPKYLLGKNLKQKTQFGDVFLGRKPSEDGLGHESPPSQGISASSSEQQHLFSCGPSSTTVTVTATITKITDDESNWVSSPKDTVFPETIPEESSSTEEEHVVIFRLPSLHESDGFIRDPSIYTAETSLFQLAMRKTTGSKNNVKSGEVSTPVGTEGKQSKPAIQKIGFIKTSSSSTDKDSVDSSKHASTEGPGGDMEGSRKTLPGQTGDITSATYLDVAVLRCLFITHWQEEGIYWALHYLYNRLRDISEETSAQQQPRRRSNSLPIPKIEVSLYQSTELKKQENNKDFIEVPEVKDVSLLAESPYTNKKSLDEPVHLRRVSEKTKKRMKMADLKAFVETKLLSKSDKALEKIGQDEPKPLGEHAVGARRMLSDYHRSLDTGDEHLSRPSSAMSKMFEPMPSNLVKGKSMPSLSCLIDELTSGGYIGEIHWDRRRPSRFERPSQPMANPIITVTEHTPTPSPDYLKRQGSMDSQLDAASLSGSKLGNWYERKASLTRSQTDSNITYAGEDIPEAPGSACYITKEGDIDLQVVLKAVHTTSLRENSTCTLRVLEVILNLIELLMDIGVLKQCLRNEISGSASTSGQTTSPGKTQKMPQSTTFASLGGEIEKSSKPMTSHRIIMNVIIKVLKHLGCPHGCADGQRGPAAEFLRTQCQNILAKLNRASGKQFKNFLRDYVKNQTIPDILDFFHAYVGYCIDPSSLLSPLNQKRGSSRSPDTVSQGGYGTNFDTGVGGGGMRGVEGQVMTHVFKPLVTRFVGSAKELKTPENLGIYCEVRQLMTYVKEGHGSVFRRVALSALIDTADRPSKKESNTQTTRVIRHMHYSEMDDQQDIPTDTSYTIDEKGVRKLLFKKRSTSSTCASLLETEAEELSKISQSPLGNIRKRHILTPRQSEKALGISEPASKTKSKSKLGGIVNWFKKSDQTSLDNNENLDNGDSGTDTSSFIRQPSKYYPNKTGKSNVGQTLQKAKRRVEDRFNKYVLKKGKKKDGSTEESSGGYHSRRNSIEMGESSRESEFVVFKERKLVATAPVYQGALRLSFLLETCPPGSVPDAYLLASMLDLPHSTVVARATLFLECAYFVHCCNKGQWPSWMKLNFPMFRPSGPLPARGPTTGIRRSHIMQKAAGKMFYQWAEVLGQRLEEIINEDKQLEPHVAAMVLDEQKQKELLMQDEEEDFLDEASINTYGSSCPMALRLIACILLHEITGFLRETYQTLPKSSRMTGKERPVPWERYYSKEANRRWSMALSSMGHSQTSAQSLQSIAGDRDSGQAERKISFVLHEPDNESEGSSNTTVTMQAMMQGEDGKRIGGQPPRPYLLRRGTAAPTGGSFKRRSLKLRRGTKEGKDMEIEWRIPETVKRTDSIQSKRKVSSLSDRSDTSEPGMPGEASGEESPGVLSDDQPPESPSDSNDTDDTTKNMPWMKIMVQVSNSFYYFCTHQNFCHPFCYRRVMRACSRLVKAVRKVYGEEFGVLDDKLNMDFGGKKKGKKDKSHNRKVSDQTSSQVSPIRRKDSVGKKDKIEKNLDGSQLSKLASKDSCRDIAESETGQDSSKSNNDEKPSEPPPILKYIKTQVKDAFHSPLAVLLKGAVILSEEHFVEIIPVAWELLLETNQEVTACAASLFILAAVKAPQQVSEIMQHGLSHPDPAVRINAILRFQVLWKMRYQVWPRMEENAHILFKVPPPGIEFTLPSPKIGIESLDVVDSPWELLVKTKVEEVTINQERHRSLVTATKTRKKQQTELIKMALQAQDDKKREERENFLITTIPITIQAAHEPSLYHTSEEHDEADDEQAEGQTRNTVHHLHSAHSLFPSCLCSAVVQIITLLDDAAVSADGNAVYEVAYQVIWCCLVEDSALFLRYILERLTREKQEQMFKILRHVIRFIPKLPQQAAFALYNYIIGYVMFYVRSPHEDGQMLIGAALSLLWMVVHSVQGIMFKDLKQILRKEQCDASILLTANVPSAKKIIVHGPQDPDAGGIPSQFPIQEDTQFCQILREALDFFGIDDNRHKEFFLVDYKTHQIRNPSSYVRDYYFFKRSQYPQLELIHMKPEEAFNALQKQELLHKFVEIGKVLLTWAILKNVDMVVQRVVFLHEELMKLPSFPRKALESDLDLYKGGTLGKELLGLDVLHKFMWVRLIARMFEAMAGNFAYSGDIHLFLNVLNGSVILHSEDACILRYVMATYINAAFHFKNIFSTNGYLLIMPTLLKIYSNHQTNKLVTTTVEYAVKQFYLMNRKPFILQMFGSVSAMLDTDEEGTFGDAHKIQSSCLFNLLLSLETPSPDPLNIAELVKEDKPLKAIDFCYHDENEMVTILDCISLCVMVVSYSSESVRGYQMLIILEAILPCYVQHIQLPSYNKEGKTEKEIINQLAVSIKTLVNNCEALTKSYNGPYRSSPEHKGSSQRNYSRGPYSPGFDFEDESHSKFMSEHSRAKSMYEHDVEDSEVLRAEYRRPRDVLLSLVGEFMCRATARLTELNKKNNQEGKNIELLDIRSHIRLADIAHTLLKVSPYDPESMGCRGLQHYMSYILPSTEWANDAMRPALVTILRRLDKVFQKISKKPSIRRNTDWDAAAGLLKGIYDTMVKYPYIMHWQHIKALINTCQFLIVSDCYASEGVSSATAALMSQAPPPHFCSMVVRLIALQIQSTTDNFSLEQVCGGSSTFATQDKTESMIMNLIMPLCLRVGSGRKDVFAMKQSDISFAITLVLHAMSPPSTKSVASSGTRDTKTSSKINTSLYQVSFLALKIMMICFEGELITVWTKIARTMRELGKRNEAATFLWDFLDFVVTHRTPLFILMQPFIFQKLAQPPISDFERTIHSRIRDKIRGIGLPFPKSRGALLMELAHEMKELKEELEDASENTDPKKQEATQPTVQMTSETNHGRHQRHSLIGLFTGDHGSKGSTDHPHTTLPAKVPESSTSTSHVSTPNQAASDGQDANANGTSTPCNTIIDRSSQRSSVSDDHGIQMPKSESLISHKAHKLRFVSSVEFRHSSGETSTTPLSPGSPADDSSGENHPSKSRLQRIKPQSRKTFRIRKSRKNSRVEISHTKLQSEETPQPDSPPKTTPQPTEPKEETPPPNNNNLQQQSQPQISDQHRLRISMRGKPTESSWDEDSAISQTSSTSGYRESYPVMHLRENLESSPKSFPPLASPDIHDLPSTSSATTTNLQCDNSSPDCSLNENGERTALLSHTERSSSQHSLLMVFEQQDETTLI